MTALPETSAARSTSEIASYHAHVYYDPATTREEPERFANWKWCLDLTLRLAVAAQAQVSARPGTPGRKRRSARRLSAKQR